MALLYGPIQIDTIDPVEVVREAFRDQVSDFTPGDIRIQRYRIPINPTTLAWVFSFTATAPPVRQMDIIRLAVRSSAGHWCVAGRLDYPEIANGIVLFDPDHGFLLVADTDGEHPEVLCDIVFDHIEMINGG